MVKYMTKDATIANVRKIFASTQADSMSIEDVIRAWGREGGLNKSNRRWFDGKFMHWKYHNLVKPGYIRSNNNRRVLSKIHLTLEGKRSIGRIEDSEGNDADKVRTSSNGLSLPDLTKQVAKFKEENPDYQITFEVKLKNQ